MNIDNWPIDEDEVLASDYGDGTVFTVQNLIIYVLRHPNQFDKDGKIIKEMQQGIDENKPQV